MLDVLMGALDYFYPMFAYFLLVGFYLRWKVKKKLLIFAGGISILRAVLEVVLYPLSIPALIVDIPIIMIALGLIAISIIFVEGRWWRRILLLIMSQIIVSEIFDMFNNILYLCIGDYRSTTYEILRLTVVPLAVFVLILLASLPGSKTKSKLGLLPLFIVFLSVIAVDLYASIFQVFIVPNAMGVSVDFETSEVTKAIWDMSSSYNILILITSVVIIFLVLTITNFVVTQRIYRRNAEVNETMLASQTKYYESVEENAEAMRKLRHDYKNHLTVLSLLIDNGDVDKAKEYINSINDSLNSATPVAHTGNTIADAIITDKFQKASELGIKLAVDGIFSYKEMKAVDICSILANILDNAIEALSSGNKKKDGNELSSKDITLNFSKTDSFFVITESNLSTKALVLDGDKIVTSKIDKVLHGMGIGNIKESAEKYGGEVDIKCEPSKSHDDEYVFTISILIPFLAEE